MELVEGPTPLAKRGCGQCSWCYADLPPCPWGRFPRYWKSGQVQSGWIHEQEGQRV